MSSIAIGQSLRLRSLAAGIKHEVERLDATMAHRELWLEKAPDYDDHVLSAYARTVDNALDRVMAKACAAKEAVWAMRGGA